MTNAIFAKDLQLLRFSRSPEAGGFLRNKNHPWGTLGVPSSDPLCVESQKFLKLNYETRWYHGNNTCRSSPHYITPEIGWPLNCLNSFYINTGLLNFIKRLGVHTNKADREWRREQANVNTRVTDLIKVQLDDVLVNVVSLDTETCNIL